MSLNMKYLLAGSTIALISSVSLIHLVSADPLPVVKIAQRIGQHNAGDIEKAGETDKKEESDLKEEQQLQRWQSQAKVTLIQAIQTAESTQSNKATSAELKAEYGSLIYAIDIGMKEVIVDAGNGKILATKDLTQSNSRLPKFNGSIRASENLMGDGDGEANDDG